MCIRDRNNTEEINSMNKKILNLLNIKEHPSKKHIDRKLIFRIRMFYVIAIILTGLMLYEVLEGIIGIELSFAGFLLGLFLGFIATRMFIIHWHDERATGLRQPEVSIAMRQLTPFDWVNESEENKPGKGRPNKVYSLKVGFKDIIAHLEKQQKKAHEEAQARIKRLKELGKD